MPSSAAIQRYLRRHVHKKSFDVFVACLPELENDTLTEIQHLIPGLMPSPVKGGVSVQATLPDVYRMNLGLSTANRVLLRLATFPAWSFPMLFDNAARIFWPAFVTAPSSAQFRVTSRMSRLNMANRIASTIRTAIEGSFGDGNDTPRGGTSTIFVRIVRDSVTLSLDTSGEHLHKRGDKILTEVAPIRSTLASAGLKLLLKASPSVVCDPFCGSGTILMEAARFIHGIAPGANRAFAFMDHPYFRAGSWRQSIRDDERHREAIPNTTLVGGDADESAVKTTRTNLASLGRGTWEKMDLDVRDFRASLDLLRADRVALITNPPYGVRLGSRRDAQQLQRAFVKHLEGIRSNTEFVVFTPFADLYLASQLSIVGMTPLRVGGIKVNMVHGHAGGFT